MNQALNRWEIWKELTRSIAAIAKRRTAGDCIA